MGLLVDGQWKDVWYDTANTGGRFVRQDSAFRSRITADGSSGYPAVSGRYHLYVSLACPWAHRTLIARRLKGLEDHISVSVVHPLMLDNGWTFASGPGVIADPVHGADCLHQVYTAAKPDYTGRVTVPVLWDLEAGTIVNNESSEILRMFDAELDALTADGPRWYPGALRDEIDEINDLVYHRVNNGVYKAGFATSQEAYDEAVQALFETLDELEARLASRRYLVGSQLTEADWRLWTTIVRFDAVYHGHFKCNRRRIVDYPNLWGWARELWQVPGVVDTVDFEHITTHYYASHRTINPTGIVPIGPATDWWSAHGRESAGAPD
jgi:putative glutathione S-transferase